MLRVIRILNIETELFYVKNKTKREKDDYGNNESGDY